MEDRIVFKITIGYYLEVLAPETMKVLGNTKNEITKDKNDENIPHLETTEVVLVHCNIANNSYQQQEFCIHLFLINHLVNY